MHYRYLGKWLIWSLEPTPKDDVVHLMFLLLSMPAYAILPCAPVCLKHIQQGN